MNVKEEIIWINDKDEKQTAFKIINETKSGHVLKATLIKQKDFNEKITDNYDVKIGRYKSRDNDNFKTNTITTSYRDKYEMGVYLSKSELGELINFINEANLIVKENEGKNKYLKVNDNNLTILEEINKNPTLIKNLPLEQLEYAKNEYDIQSLNIEEFQNMIDNVELKEKDWQNFFQKNIHLLQLSIPSFFKFFGGNLFAGGKNTKNRGGNYPDFGFTDSLNSISFIEIKTPQTVLMEEKEYRNQAFPVSSELNGGVMQALSQRHIYYSKESDSRDNNPFYNSPCYLIIGNISKLDDNKKKSFSLFRNSLVNINIITFDEILSRLKFFLKTIKKDNSKYDLTKYDI